MPRWMDGTSALPLRHGEPLRIPSVSQVGGCICATCRTVSCITVSDIRPPFLTWMPDSDLQRTRPPWLVCGLRLSRVEGVVSGSEAMRDISRLAIEHKSPHLIRCAAKGECWHDASGGEWLHVAIMGHAHTHRVSQDEKSGRDPAPAGKSIAALRPPFQGRTSRALCRCQAGNTSLKSTVALQRWSVPHQALE